MTTKLTTRRPRSLFPWRREPQLSLREDLEDLFSSLWDGEPGWPLEEIAPSVNLSETDKSIELTMDLPGVDSKEIDIRLNNNILTVSGRKKEEKEDKGRRYHRVERRTGEFSRSFQLPYPVAEDKVKAEYDDGVLTIILPKTEEAKPRRIAVKG